LVKHKLGVLLLKLGNLGGSQHLRLASWSLGLNKSSRLVDGLIFNVLRLFELVSVLSTSSVCLLPLLLLDVDLNLLVHINFKFSKALSRQLVKLKFEDGVVRLGHALLHNGNNSFLLLKSQLANVCFKLAFLLDRKVLQRRVSVDSHRACLLVACFTLGSFVTLLAHWGLFLCFHRWLLGDNLFGSFLSLCLGFV